MDETGVEGEQRERAWLLGWMMCVGMRFAHCMGGGIEPFWI
jgi:hypothetical protein